MPIEGQRTGIDHYHYTRHSEVKLHTHGTSLTALDVDEVYRVCRGVRVFFAGLRVIESVYAREMGPDANGLAGPVVVGGLRCLQYEVVSDIEAATVNKNNVVLNCGQLLRCRGVGGSSRTRYCQNPADSDY